MKILLELTEKDTGEKAFRRLSPQIKKMFGEARFGKYELELKKPKRTLQQNKALHLYFTLLAKAFNDAGLDMKKIIKKDVQIPWYTETIKNMLWRPIQKSVLGEESTAKLNTRQIDEVYAVLNRHIGEKFGIHIPFPDKPSQLQNYEI